MARLHEHQGKALLKSHGVAVPRGGVATTPEDAKRIAAELFGESPGRVVLKVQAWTTGRAEKGGVRFATRPEEAEDIASTLLAMTFGNFPVREVLVEEALHLRDEIFVSFAIDDAAMAPVLLIDTAGGTGIEERAANVERLPVDLHEGPDRAKVLEVFRRSPIEPAYHEALADAIHAAYETMRVVEARSLEINPLVTLNGSTPTGSVAAADCRITIDDYAVFRHPELNIKIARELDHPPTDLERIAYRVEQEDHRGTFYFAQLETSGSAEASGGERRSDEATERRRGGPAPGATEEAAPTPPGPRSPTPNPSPLIAFHGAGGGGSMMSMDAVTNAGFRLANFCDTSGNPSASKVYKAARIILAQPGLVGYFGSGSGVASQEQFWSAYGLAKAFLELNLSIPAVLRLGGNGEDRAVEILEDACRELPPPGKVEGYKKDDTPQFCAERFATLVNERRRGGGEESKSDGATKRRSDGEGKKAAGTPAPPSPQSPVPNPSPNASTHIRDVPSFVNSDSAYSFPITSGGGGTVWIDHASCDEATTRLVVEHSHGLLRPNAAGKPVLAVPEEDAAGKDSEFIACEIECRRARRPGGAVVFVDLPIEGLD